MNNSLLSSADIADRLHDVMETQWQRALEIIASPTEVGQQQVATNERHCPTRPIDTTKLDKDKADGVAGLYQNKPENEIFDTPTSSRTKRRQQSTSGSNGADKLQAYIDLVSLTKFISSN